MAEQLPTPNKAVEALRLRRQVLSDMRRIVEGVGHDQRHIILLDDYEVTNLREALQACGYGVFDKNPETGKNQGSPLDVLHTGDWLGQIVQKLPYIEGYKSNVPILTLRQRAREWRG